MWPMKTLVVLLLLTAACLSAAEVQTPAQSQIVTVVTARMPNMFIVGQAEKAPDAIPSALAFHGPAGPPPICPADGPDVCGGGPTPNPCSLCFILDFVCLIVCVLGGGDILSS